MIQLLNYECTCSNGWDMHSNYLTNLYQMLRKYSSKQIKCHQLSQMTI